MAAINKWIQNLFSWYNKEKQLEVNTMPRLARGRSQSGIYHVLLSIVEKSGEQGIW